MRDYIAFLKHNRKTANDVGLRLAAHVVPALGKRKVGELTADMLRKWHSDLAKQPSRLRTKAGAKQRHKPITTDPEQARRWQSSANRCLGQLKAALNFAWREGKADSDAAWRRVTPFKGADAARARYLTIAECQRLLNASDPDFRAMVRGALETGCRYGELTRLTVADHNPDAGTLAIRTSKTSRPRHVVLTEEGITFFGQACVGRAGSEIIFRKASGAPWRSSDPTPTHVPCMPPCRDRSADRVPRSAPHMGIAHGDERRAVDRRRQEPGPQRHPYMRKAGQGSMQATRKWRAGLG